MSLKYPKKAAHTGSDNQLKVRGVDAQTQVIHPASCGARRKWSGGGRVAGHQSRSAATSTRTAAGGHVLVPNYFIKNPQLPSSSSNSMNYFTVFSQKMCQSRRFLWCLEIILPNSVSFLYIFKIIQSY